MYSFLITLRTVLENKIFQKYRPSYLKHSDLTKNEEKVWSPILAKWVCIKAF